MMGNWEVGRPAVSSALPVTGTKSWIGVLLSGALNSSYENTDLTNTITNPPKGLVLVFHTGHKQSAPRWQPEIQSKYCWHMSQQLWMSNLNVELWWSFMFSISSLWRVSVPWRVHSWSYPSLLTLSHTEPLGYSFREPLNPSNVSFSGGTGRVFIHNVAINVSLLDSQTRYLAHWVLLCSSKSPNKHRENLSRNAWMASWLN